MSQLPEGAKSESTSELIEKLRIECRERGFTLDHITDHALGYVLHIVNQDINLAADSLEMRPRPKWVEEFCGP